MRDLVGTTPTTLESGVSLRNKISRFFCFSVFSDHGTSGFFRTSFSSTFNTSVNSDGAPWQLLSSKWAKIIERGLPANQHMSVFSPNTFLSDHDAPCEVAVEKIYQSSGYVRVQRHTFVSPTSQIFFKKIVPWYDSPDRPPLAE